jgi:hypothetical protein
MNISKQSLEILIRDAYYSGMNDGYAVDHEHKSEDEDTAWEEYKKTVKELN